MDVGERGNAGSFNQRGREAAFRIRVDRQAINQIEAIEIQADWPFGPSAEVFNSIVPGGVMDVLFPVLGVTAGLLVLGQLLVSAGPSSGCSRRGDSPTGSDLGQRIGSDDLQR
jgi:hypothetical protein